MIRKLNDRFVQFLLYGILPFAVLFLAFFFGAGVLSALLIFACLMIGLLIPRKRWLAPDLGLGALPVVALISLSVLLGNTVYRALQDRMQTNLYKATAAVDVLADLCARVPGVVQLDCAGPVLTLEDEGEKGDKRGQLSWLAIWSILRETNLLDERNFPDPGALTSSERTDIATAMTVDFLRGEARMGETSFGLLRALTRPCGIAGQSTITNASKEQDAALDLALAFTLADLQDRVLDSTHPALRKRTDSDALKELSDLRLYEFSRSDLKTLLGTTDKFSDFRDLARKAMPQPYRDEEILTSLLLSGAAYDSDNPEAPNSYLELRLSKVGRDTIASYVRMTENSDDLSSLCSVILNKTEKPRQGQGSANPVTTAATAITDRFKIEKPEQFFQALKMREEIALTIAGRIRTADSTRDERFWLTLVTGYEQFAMIVLFIFGLLIASFRLAGLGWAYLARDIWFAPGQVPPGTLLFSLRSSRWPLRLIAAILPAIGFVGTVRGIMLSLTGADQIVWATTINERSAAISGLSTDLGLAFATTLIALLLGIALSLVAGFEQRLSEVTVLRREGAEPAPEKADG